MEGPCEDRNTGPVQPQWGAPEVHRQGEMIRPTPPKLLWEHGPAHTFILALGLPELRVSFSCIRPRHDSLLWHP